MNDRLKHQLRVNRSLKSQSTWLLALSHAMSCSTDEITLFDVVETRQFKRIFLSTLREGAGVTKSIFQSDEEAQVLIHFDELAISHGEQDVLLFHRLDDVFGAVRTQIRDISRNPFGIWKVLEDDLAITSLNSKAGLCLEKNWSDEFGNFVKSGQYELTTWGPFV